jgi:molybdopterin-containing oxidoreductase family membrane subunit
LAVIVTYAMAVNVFFVLMELFTAIYSGIPEHILHFQYLFLGIGDSKVLVPWMWTSAILSVVALVLLINPGTRKNEKTLVIACIAVFIALWIEKGLGLVVTGFIPNPLGVVHEYFPTFPEAMIALGVYGIGLLIITVLYKIALSVRGEVSR